MPQPLPACLLNSLPAPLSSIPCTQEHLFEQLEQLLSRALGEPEGGREQAATVRLLGCKVEEIHTTLRKHLRKEEEQLLPLLLAHFSAGEQAELVAQFLCSIPLSTVEVRLRYNRGCGMGAGAVRLWLQYCCLIVVCGLCAWAQFLCSIPLSTVEAR